MGETEWTPDVAKPVSAYVWSKLAQPYRQFMLHTMRTVIGPLGERTYSISIGAGLLPMLGAECAKLGLGKRCAVVSDMHVAPKYGKACLGSLRDASFDAL